MVVLTSNMLDNTGPLHGPLHYGFVNMVAAFFSGLCVLPPMLLGEDPLPPPVGGRVGAFARAPLLRPGPVRGSL